MSLLDTLQARYSDQVELVKVEVDGLDPFYFRPTACVTPVERSKIDKLHENLSMDKAPDILIYRARNPDGSKMFKPDDGDKLRKLVLADDLIAMVGKMIDIDKQYEVDKKKY